MDFKYRTLAYLYKPPGKTSHTIIFHFIEELRPLIADYYKKESVRLPLRENLVQHLPPAGSEV